MLRVFPDIATLVLLKKAVSIGERLSETKLSAGKTCGGLASEMVAIKSVLSSSGLDAMAFTIVVRMVVTCICQRGGMIRSVVVENLTLDAVHRSKSTSRLLICDRGRKASTIR